MARTFIAITQADIDLKLAQSIKSRELELLNYDFEQASHEAVIASSADNWDAGTSKYKGLSRDLLIKAVQADGASKATLTRVAALANKDKAAHELEAVKIELAKSEKHLTNLLTLLPEERRAAAFAALAALEAK